MLTVFLFSLVSLHVSESFRWVAAPQNGSTIFRCVGDDVTFPWNYVIEHDEDVIAVYWFSNKNASFASYFQRFLRSSSRVTHAGNAAVTLSDVSKKDDDIYGVGVKLYGRQEPEVLYVNLVIAEPPEVAEEGLHVLQQDESPLEGESSRPYGSHITLACGRFLSQGSPPASVIWTDPQGDIFPSTTFRDGFFLLRIHPYAEGGNFLCALNTSSPSAQCVRDGASSRWQASVSVVTLDTIVAEQKEDLEELQLVMDDIKNETSAEKLEACSRLMEDLSERVDVLQQESVNLTHDLAFLRKREDTRATESQESLQELGQALRSQLKAVAEKSREELQNGLRDVNTTLHPLSGNASILHAEHGRHNSAIGDLRHRVTGLEQATERQESDNEKFQRRLTEVANAVGSHTDLATAMQQNMTEFQVASQRQQERQQADYDELQRRLTEAEDASDRQADVVSDVRRHVSEIQGICQQLNETQETGSADTQRRLHDLQTDQDGLRSRVDLLADNVQLVFNTSTQLAQQVTSEMATLREQRGPLNVTAILDRMMHLENRQQELQAENKNLTTELQRLQSREATLEKRADVLESETSFLKIYIDECVSNPCQNNGTCEDHVNAYLCHCLPGYTGLQCETDMDECASDPCQNNGTCEDQANGYLCLCSPGYSGQQCETESNECDSGPCANGGTCQDQINGYLCHCLPGYSGPQCHTDPWSISCTFESGFCEWTNAHDDVFDWTRHSGRTPSDDTGPSHDAGHDGFYAYIETSSPREENDNARLESPLLPPSAPYCLQFSYHMLGSHIGQLNVRIKANGEAQSPIWSKSGPSSNTWKQGTIDIPAQNSNFSIVLEGVRGTGYQGDVSIDDLVLTETLCSFVDNDYYDDYDY